MATTVQYHISPATGRPNKCTATKRACPVGGEHFPTKEAAQAAYEAQQKGRVLPASAKKIPVQTSAPSVNWYEVPLTPQEEVRLETMKGAQTPPGDLEQEKIRLMQRAHWAGTERAPRVWPAVPTDRELDKLEAELRDELAGYSVAELLRTRAVSSQSVLRAELEGGSHGSYLTLKVPGHYEVSIPTDLARRELGMQPRPKTASDRSPLRSAELELLEAESKLFGVVHSAESHRAASDAYEAARSRVKILRDEAAAVRVRAAMALTRRPGPKGEVVSVANEGGREVGTVAVLAADNYSVAMNRPSLHNTTSEFVGTYESEEAALLGLAAAVRHSFYYR